MNEKTYTVLCPFGGLGAGALGFVRAETRLFETRASFKLLGGVDVDAAACADFETLTGVPQWNADVWDVTAEDVRARFGAKAPDVVFASPPCKGASGLLSEKKAKTAKYRKLNKLALRWIHLMLEAWKDAPPRLVLFENVPRIVSRAKRMLDAVKAHLRRAGYLIHEGAHDAGEIGGLAQHRRRYLLVARHQSSVPALLYQPVKKRVRACGEVLGPLPMPNDPEGGPLHRLPAIGWLNWVRLALIPAGGDWRDLPGVLEEGEKRRDKFKRHAIEEWKEPVGTIGGSGSNGVENVADPRPGDWFRGVLGVSSFDEPSPTVTGRSTPSTGRYAVADPRVKCAPRAGAYGVLPFDQPAPTVSGSAGIDNATAAVADPRPFGNVNRVTGWDKPTGTVTHSPAPSSGAPAIADPRVRHKGSMGVLPFDAPAGTVTGESYPSNGSFAVADPRVTLKMGADAHANVLRVSPWEDPAGTVTGASRPSQGAVSVADPRARAWFGNVLRIVPWGEPSLTVTSGNGPTNGGGCVADPRVRTGFDHGYKVTPWGSPSDTVAAGSHPGQGAYSVADPRVEKAALVGIIPLADARATVTGELPAPFSVVDPGTDGAPLMVVRDVAKAPPAAPVILAEDGTWHRPLTTLELAVLQGLPHVVNGAPLQLAGTSASAHRERIGNAVPVQAAEAIAGQMLLTLLSSDMQSFALSSGGSIWVVPEGAHEDLFGTVEEAVQ